MNPSLSLWPNQAVERRGVLGICFLSKLPDFVRLVYGRGSAVRSAEVRSSRNASSTASKWD